DYIAGPTLFPGQVIAGYNAPNDAYTAETWAKYILDKAKSFDAAKSCCSFSAINSGSTGGRFWFGYVFRASAAPDDFER
ncbi:hypothetical protein K435DRAFT_630891, partial [Dendrothele bispora CBS 962.96]